MSATADVVVVGGGIAGSGLATVLARKGLDVLVLERETTYRDKVRGETMTPWGVAEVFRLGLEEALLGAGGGYCTRAILYDETFEREEAEALVFALDRVVAGAPGSLNVGHPEACEALIKAAAKSGARVVRGIGAVRVVPGAAPSVTYELDDVEHQVRCRLVVGADGRNSQVRRQIGAEMHATAPRTIGGGMLVARLDEWPSDLQSLGTEGNVHYLVFPRPGGRARLYLMWDIAQKARFVGPNCKADFLDAFRLACLPHAEAIASAEPAGPCASYPMNDTWIDRPFAEGVVLVGDAAGWNDPVIGQGLSIAMRDARTVADLLDAGSDWSVAAFSSYGEERTERLRRLRLSAELTTDLRCTFSPEGRARRKAWHSRMFEDALLAAPVMIQLAGPETAPAEAFTPENLERIRSLS